jgi:hypothetical protein
VSDYCFGVVDSCLSKNERTPSYRGAHAPWQQRAVMGSDPQRLSHCARAVAEFAGLTPSARHTVEADAGIILSLFPIGFSLEQCVAWRRTRRTRCPARPGRGHLLCVRCGVDSHARRGIVALSLARSRLRRRCRQRRRCRCLCCYCCFCRRTKARYGIVSQGTLLRCASTRGVVRRHDAE